MSAYDKLDLYQQWMVRSNIETIRVTDVTVAEQVALLRANGYPSIAEGVEAVVKELPWCPECGVGSGELHRIQCSTVLMDAEKHSTEGIDAS